MVKVNFPDPPLTVGQTFKTGGYTYQWDGQGWLSNPPNSAIPDAPNDGLIYGRQSRAWVNLTGAAGFVKKSGDSMTGVLGIVDGTVAAPGLAWASEPGLGLYRSAAGVIRFAVGGTDSTVIDAAGAANTTVTVAPRTTGLSVISLSNQPTGVTNRNNTQLIQNPDGSSILRNLPVGTATKGSITYDASGHNFSGNVTFANSTTHTGQASFPGGATFAGGATGITAAMVGLGNVLNERQVGSIENGQVRLGWTGSGMSCQVDATYFGTTWPINITGNASGNAGSANRTLQSDRCENWGYASGNFTHPYMRLDTSANLHYLIYQTANDDSVLSFKLYSASPYLLEVTGSGGVFGITAQPSDERLKRNIHPSRVNATDVINHIRMVEYDDIDSGIHHRIGVLAQNLQSLDDQLAFGVAQPEGSPWHDLGTVLNPNPQVVGWYLIKALQETMARVKRLEHHHG